MRYTMYRQIDCRFWMDPKTRKMGPGPLRELFIYLMTNMHTHLCGMYYLPMVLISHETGFSIDETTVRMAELEELGRVKYDHESEVVWVVNMLKHQVMSKSGTISEKSKAAIRSQMDTLSIPYLRDEMYSRYPIDTLSIDHRYPIDRPSDAGLQVKVKVKVKEEEEEEEEEASHLSPSSPPAQEIQDQPEPDTPIDKPSSWLPGERRPTGGESVAIVELQHLWAKLWKKDPPTIEPRGDDRDRMVEALRGGQHMDGETIAMAKRAVRGHHKRASKDGSQMGRDFAFCFPKLSRGNKVIGNRLDFAKYESFALEIKERKPPPPAPAPEAVEPGATLEEAQAAIKKIREDLVR